jgi:tRNA nucleotidyltransferase (CCA-adding enzyme)
MEIYLVGGAVRDQLLGLPVKEKDWVVTGSTPAEMLKKGYRQVGKDFPVFLHPETNEEYALARMERKVGKGYTGFDFDASAKVTLEEDLLRRDLTINAIAQTLKGDYVDPFHGQEDLQKKILRHVSPAFVEDPVRILRIARFSARFVSLGFNIAPETLAFMREMVKSGEVNALVAERVWKELERALAEKNPEQFFQVLQECGALAVLFPEIDDKHILLLKKTAAVTKDVEIRFSALMFNLNPDQKNFRFPTLKFKPNPDHIIQFCQKYRVGNDFRDLALLVSGHYQDAVNAKNLSAEKLLNLFQTTDAFRRGDRFEKWFAASQALATAREEQFPTEWLQQIYEAIKKTEFTTENHPHLKGKEIGDFISQQRLAAIKKFAQK